MYRTTLLRSIRCAAQATTRAQRPSVQTALRTPFVQSRISTPASSISAIRCYASSTGLNQDEVTGRIIDLLKNFDKVGRYGLMQVCDIANIVTRSWTQRRYKSWGTNYTILPLMLQTACTNFTLHQGSWSGQLGHCRGRDGNRGGGSYSNEKEYGRH